METDEAKKGQMCRKIFSFFLGLAAWGAFCKLDGIWVKLEKNVGRKFRFSAADYTAEEKKKKSSANVLSWGEKLSISRTPTLAKRLGLNLQINQKHSRGNWKGLLEDKTFLHKYKWDSWKSPHRYMMRQTYSTSVQIITKRSCGHYVGQPSLAAQHHQPMLLIFKYLNQNGLTLLRFELLIFSRHRSLC